MAEENKKEEEIEIPEKFKDLVSQIEKMSVLDLSELVKVLEKKFGVSAQMTAVAFAGAGLSKVEEEGAKEEKSTFEVVLKKAGDQKIQVIKVLKDALGLGLAEAKAITDAVPKTIKAGISKDEANELKVKLEGVGAEIEIK